MIARKVAQRSIKYRKATGTKVEVLDWSGDYIRVRSMETGKGHTLHKRWLVDSYAETNPAKEAINGKKVYNKVPCECGRLKERGSERCQKCRPKGKVMTADKICDCGNKMNYKSHQCRWCLIRDRQQGKSPTRKGRSKIEAIGPTDEEAQFLAEPPMGKDHEADAIIAKYRDAVRQAALKAKLEEGSPNVGAVSIEYTSSTFMTIGSDRRRGRA